MKAPSLAPTMLAALAALFSSTLAHAQQAEKDPKLETTKVEVVEVKPVEWKVQAKAGGLWTGGNGEVKSGTIGVTASRKRGSNKLALDGDVAYGRTNLVMPGLVDATNPMMPPMILTLRRQEVTTTNLWRVKGRYDRFITENNVAYASGQAAGDEIAGKTFYGGGQVGYSRQLFKDDRSLLVAELGYDFSHERYVQQSTKAIPPVSVHSARILVGETFKASPTTGITASVEALFNVNHEGKALNHTNGTQGVDAFKDTRINGRVGLTTTVWKALSMAFGFTVKFDQNPAPFPIPSAAPPGSVYSPLAFPATMGVPFADKVDTLAEATLIYTFL